MAGPRNQIAEILLKAGILDELQLRSALARHAQWGGRLTRVIVDMGLAREDAVTEALCRGFNLPRTHLGNLTRDGAALAKVDVAYAEERSLFPVQLRDGGKTLVLAMADPTDLQCIDQVAAKGRVRVQVMVAGDREIQNAIQRFYRGVQDSHSSRGESRDRRDIDPLVDDDDFENDGKIVDMSGNTVRKSIKDIMGDEPLSGPPPAPPVPERRDPREGQSESLRATADLLDEILGTGAPPVEEFTPEELARIDAIRVNHEKSSRILRALIELCIEKGYVRQGELAARMRG